MNSGDVILTFILCYLLVMSDIQRVVSQSREPGEGSELLTFRVLTLSEFMCTILSLLLS